MPSFMHVIDVDGIPVYHSTMTSPKGFTEDDAEKVRQLVRANRQQSESAAPKLKGRKDG